MENNEMKLTSEEMYNWLSTYIDEIIIAVMERFEEIQNDPTSVRLIKELSKEIELGKQNLTSTINQLMGNDVYAKASLENYKGNGYIRLLGSYGQHYRQALYMLWIKDYKKTK